MYVCLDVSVSSLFLVTGQTCVCVFRCINFVSVSGDFSIEFWNNSGHAVFFVLILLHDFNF